MRSRTAPGMWGAWQDHLHASPLTRLVGMTYSSSRDKPLFLLVPEMTSAAYLGWLDG